MEKIAEMEELEKTSNAPKRTAARRTRLRRVGFVAAALVATFAVFNVGVRTVAPFFLFHPNDDPAARAGLTRIAEETGSVAPLRFALDDGTAVSGWAAFAEAESVACLNDAGSLDAAERPNDADSLSCLHSLGDASTERPVVLYFEGNGGNSAARTLDVVRKPGPLAGFDFVCCDYPGYGESGGEPSERSLKTFGLAAYDATAKRFPGRRIVVFGFSLGTGVATYVASERPVVGLILAAPYADGFDLFNNFAPIFYGPARLTVPYRMEAVKFAEKVDVRPLILATRPDALVPFESAKRLAKAFSSGVEFIAQDDVEHHWVWSTEIANAEIAEYLRSLTPPKSTETRRSE
ncbi:MAG: alpha/beta fold hydrolase [Thermoguttaceae bacterium]|nr:alpha/beta fold hydrolase [Thermoguttaceae bacterium]